VSGETADETVDGSEGGHGTESRRVTTDRQLRVIIGIVVVVIVAGAGILAWPLFKDDREQAQPGDAVVAPDDVDVHGSTANVYIPWGRLELTVGSPREELPDLVNTDEKAPDGGGFVGIELASGDTDTQLPLPFVEGGRYRAPRITLVAGERRYPVPELGEGLVTRGGGNLLASQSAKVFVPVAVMPKHPSLEVTYDGVPQRVSSSGKVTPGRFKALQGVGREPEPVSCGDSPRSPKQLRGDNSPTCSLPRVMRVPYVAGLGWAAGDHEWLVLTSKVGRPEERVHAPFAEEPRFVDSDLTTTKYRLNHRRPVSQVNANDVGEELRLRAPDDPEQVVFNVPKNADDLSLKIVSTFRTDRDAKPMHVSWRVDLGDD